MRTMLKNLDCGSSSDCSGMLSNRQMHCFVVFTLSALDTCNYGAGFLALERMLIAIGSPEYMEALYSR